MPDYSDNILDQEINTEFMRVCKCVVPYLDTSIQKNVAIGLKFLELMNTINAFSENSTFSTHLALTRQQGRWEQNLLKDVRSNLSPEKAYIIDALIKFQEFKSILNTKDQHTHPHPQNAPSKPHAPTRPSSDPDVSNFTRPSSEVVDSPIQMDLFDVLEPFSPTESYDSPDTSVPPPFTPPPQSDNPQNSHSPTNGPSPASMIQMLSPLLDDNQRQMLNLFTSFLGNK